MSIPDYFKGTIVSFDTETAQMGDHVCEIGFSIFENCQLINEISLLVKPIVEIEEGAEAVHHISNIDVENQPAFKDLLPFIYNTLNSADIHCAYNYEYDRNVLEKEFSRYGMKFPLKPMADPFILFKRWNKYNRGKKLTDATQKYGIELIGAHRASNDSTATGNLLLKIAAVRTDFPKTIEKFIAMQRKWVQEQFEDFYGYCKKSGRNLPTQPNYDYYEVVV